MISGIDRRGLRRRAEPRSSRTQGSRVLVGSMSPNQDRRKTESSSSSMTVQCVLSGDLHILHLSNHHRLEASPFAGLASLHPHLSSTFPSKIGGASGDMVQSRAERRGPLPAVGRVQNMPPSPVYMGMYEKRVLQRFGQCQAKQGKSSICLQASSISRSSSHSKPAGDVPHQKSTAPNLPTNKVRHQATHWVRYLISCVM